MTQEPKRIKLITDVSEFGLLQPLARTRGRLIASVILSAAAMIGLTLWVSHFVIHTSTSVGLNLALITATMLFLLLTSYLEAMLIGDLFFPGRWRERVLLGKKLPMSEAEALSVARAPNTNALFLGAVVVAIIGNYVATNALTDDYLDTYHTLGFHLTNLRAEEPEAKINALREVSKEMHADLWRDDLLSAAILRQLEHPNPDVRQWALWTIGQAKYPEGLTLLPPHLQGGTPDTQAEAALALGKLQDKRATPTLTKLLTDPNTPTPLKLAATRATAILKDPASLPALTPLLTHPDTTLRAHAFWAIGQLRDTTARPTILSILNNPKTSPQDTCNALDTLKFLAVPDDIPTFKERLILENKNPECPWILWETRNEKKHYIGWKESIHTKYIKIIFNAGERDISWYETIAVDKDKPHDVRLTASNLVRDLKKSNGL